LKTVQEYRRHADECRELAKSARSLEERRTLLDMVATWEGLALAQERKAAAQDTISLSDRMRALARGHPRERELIESADAFDKATTDFDGDLRSALNLAESWERARKLWSEVTGEPLS